MRILLTNDDGYMAAGIRTIYGALTEAGHDVTMVAPESEKSGVSLSITTTDILRAWPIELDGITGWRVNGNPADCVKLGVRELMPERPDVVISGINQGTNVGLNANYSGTIAGAVEGAMFGLPGVAVSLDSFRSKDFRAAAGVAVEVLEKLAADPSLLPSMHVLSINVPEGEPGQLRGLRITPAARVAYREIIDRRVDHRGHDYYWLGGQIEELEPNGRGDHHAVMEGYATITPLRVDWTSEELVGRLREAGWEREKAGGGMSQGFDKIAVLDFGSQYTQLIARRIREQGVYAEILPCDASLEAVQSLDPVALILSGGPASVYEENAPSADPKLLELGLPVLGICYGMGWMAKQLGGEVSPSDHREYGRREVQVFDADATPLVNVSSETTTWMSHGDQIDVLPHGFKKIASSITCPIAAMADPERNFFAVQFHPEVRHTDEGTEMLRTFLLDIAKAKTGWSMEAFEQQEIERIRAEVGGGTVIGGVSGGVDSSVMAVLLARALGEKFIAIFVDNGLLRKNERQQVEELLAGKLGVHLEVVDARGKFLDALKEIEEPEAKRKAIGRVFVEVFEEEASKHPDADWLAQGTLYPDVIESVSFKGPSATIKTHHNVGGLPERMKLKLIEPLRELFKDEVRELGRGLGLTEEVVGRHPFPGPGLAVRVLGEVTEERLAMLREADAIFIEELRAAGWYDKVSQALVVLLPVKSVGVMGDYRTYEHVVALRSVDTWDFMTADFSRLPHDLLGKVSTRIINEVKGVNRVVYDVSSKPPATVEWE